MKTNRSLTGIALCMAPCLTVACLMVPGIAAAETGQTNAPAAVGQVNAEDAAALSAVDRAAGQGQPGSRTSIPANAGQAAASLDRPQLSISPRLNGHRPATRSGTTAVLDDTLTSLKVAVQPLKGGVRLLSVLKDAATPRATTYDVTLPKGAEMQLDSIGGVVVREHGTTTSRFSAPWAIDAAGRSLPTHYTLSGNALTQVVDTRDATFPVVADPKWIWDFKNTGYYFNRMETRDLGVVAGAAAAFASFAPPPFDVLLMVYGVALSAHAGLANSHGHCVWLNSAGLPGEYWGTAGQGYCR